MQNGKWGDSAPYFYVYTIKKLCGKCLNHRYFFLFLVKTMVLCRYGMQEGVFNHCSALARAQSGNGLVVLFPPYKYLWNGKSVLSIGLLNIWQELYL